MSESHLQFQLPETQPHQWLELEQAMRLTGLSDRHLRRVAGDTWMAEGKARLFTEPGRKPRWQIRDDAHPAFAPISSEPNALPIAQADLRTIAKPLIDKAANKLRLVKEWEQAVTAAHIIGISEAEATRRFCDKNGVSRASLFNWRRDFKNEKLSGLVDKRSTKGQYRQKLKSDDPFLAEIKNLYLHQNERTFQWCYDEAVRKARELRWDITSPSIARRFIKGLDKREVILHRKGPEAFKNLVQNHIDRDYSTVSTNEIWNADHHEFDVIVQVGEKTDAKTGEVRPVLQRVWLTALQDVRSRKIVAWIIRASDPNTSAIVECIGIAFCSHGIPYKVYTDNGKDFDSKILTGITKKMRWQRRKIHVHHDQEKLGGLYAAFDIEHMHAWPWHGQSKPIERFFRTVEERFCKQFDTYCGRNTVERPEQLQQMIERGRFPTFEEFVESFGIWLEADYHLRIHTGDSMDCMPQFAWENNFTLPKRTAPEDQIRLMIQPRIRCKVGQDGIHLNKLTYGKFVLNRFWGEWVYARVGASVNSVTVWDESDNFLTIAEANEKVPFNATPELQRQAIKEMNADNRAIRESFEPRLRRHETVADRMRRLQAQTPTAQPGSMTPPPAYSPVRSKLEGQMDALQAAFEDIPRRAAGAESLSLDAAMAAYGRDEE